MLHSGRGSCARSIKHILRNQFAHQPGIQIRLLVAGHLGFVRRINRKPVTGFDEAVDVEFAVFGDIVVGGRPVVRLLNVIGVGHSGHPVQGNGKRGTRA